MTRQVYVRETELRKQVEGLKIDIDETKRKKAVAEITDSEFFQSLSERAAKIRQKQRLTSQDSPKPFCRDLGNYRACCVSGLGCNEFCYGGVSGV